MSEKFADANPEHLQVALHRAQIIQKQKDVERQNFGALEALLDYPKAAEARVESPTNRDVADVSDLLQLFRPVDYDELVEERRLADKCGYVLCPREPRMQPINQRLRALDSRKNRPPSGFNKAGTESWCSAKCLQRAAFIKLQLKHEPGWLRLHDERIDFQIPVGELDRKRPISDMESIRASRLSNSATLPLPLAPGTTSENNVSLDLDTFETRAQPLLSSQVVERITTDTQQERDMANNQHTYNAIEGYVI